MKKYARALALGLVTTQLMGCSSSTTELEPKSIDHTIEHTVRGEESKKEEPTLMEENSINNESVSESKSETSNKNTDIDSNEVTQNLDGKDRYSLALYKELKTSDKNFVFSPYSITDCFSLVYDGTSGDTRNDLNSLLGFSSRGTDFYRNYDNQVTYFEGKGVKVANKGYINKKYDDKVNKELLGTDNLEVITMNSDAADVMNKFIEDTTENKIQDLISGSAIQDKTVMVLINALYLKKSWNFNENTIVWKDGNKYKSFSEDLSLHCIKEATHDIDVIQLSYDSDEDMEKIWSIEDEIEAQKLKEQYDQNRYSMYIICNNVNSTEEKVDEFMDSLNDNKLDELLNFDDYGSLEGYTDAYFNVPNFEVKTQNSIKEKLIAMGITSAFRDDTLDFEKLGPVYISDILHGAYIKVDNEGTEAAAATAMLMFETCAIEDIGEQITKEVKADEDFIFILKDDTNNNILFMGRIAEPSEKE